VKTSAWVRRSQRTALVTVANLSDTDWQGRVVLPLSRMGVSADAVASDGGERHTRVPMRDGALRLTVPRHNYRIVLVGPTGVFPVDLPPRGQALGRPGQRLTDLCDGFTGNTLSRAWRRVGGPGAEGGIEAYRNRLCVLGADYRFVAAERPLGQDCVTVQVRVERVNMCHQNRVGLALLWPNGACVFAGPNWGRGQFWFGQWDGQKLKRSQWGGKLVASVPGEMHQPSWVRIALGAKQLRVSGSTDGKTWGPAWTTDRPAWLAGAPDRLRLGKNPDGHADKPRPGPSYDYFDDLIVGR